MTSTSQREREQSREPEQDNKAVKLYGLETLHKCMDKPLK